MRYFEKESGVQAEAYKIIKPIANELLNIRTVSEAKHYQDIQGFLRSQIRPLGKYLKKNNQTIPVITSMLDSEKNIIKHYPRHIVTNLEKIVKKK